ncbi:chemokine-like protein TAFA-5 [Salmo trutta]|uniref:Chemokine-like protein TAFA-5 n=1 Tax=Salmo trutta TaxID=8032 RepID=A0A674DTF1_SALTR|nr:chemokine-like protein TAFA-5 [Salmo trutta]XP_029580414.1 chemokine-like protein TAFA-5 [Salmo trutta]XP_029580415.1 chemokine-like protein TAFA-5 [Salmo trutta]
MPTTGYQNTTRISIHPFDRHFKSGNNEGYVETGLRSGKGMKKLSAGGGASLCCLLLLWVIYSHRLREGQLAVGTCEIVMLNRDSSVPRCTIARQTARCACRRGQIAGTTKARPACVEVRIVRSRQWCEMAPCLEGEMCGLLFNRSGWTCTKASGHIKTVMPLPKEPS